MREKKFGMNCPDCDTLMVRTTRGDRCPKCGTRYTAAAVRHFDVEDLSRLGKEFAHTKKRVTRQAARTAAFERIAHQLTRLADIQLSSRKLSDLRKGEVRTREKIIRQAVRYVRFGHLLEDLAKLAHVEWESPAKNKSRKKLVKVSIRPYRTKGGRHYVRDSR